MGRTHGYLLLMGFCWMGGITSAQAADTPPVIHYDGGASGDAYQQSQCVLELHCPPGVRNFSTVVWFHGGGLTSGHREAPKALLDRGFAVAAVEYRLSPQVKATACLEDAAAATAWVLKHIAEHGGSPDKVFIAGHSAGGYLAAMVGLDASYLSRHGCSPQQLAGIMPVSGQMVTHFTLRAERGLASHQQVVDSLAPVAHASASAPPLLLVTGEDRLDMACRTVENAWMSEVMKQAGHSRTEFYPLAGFDHNSIMEGAMPHLCHFVERISRERDQAKARP